MTGTEYTLLLVRTNVLPPLCAIGSGGGRLGSGAAAAGAAATGRGEGWRNRNSREPDEVPDEQMKIWSNQSSQSHWQTGDSTATARTNSPYILIKKLFSAR